jgi:acylphosphatase
MKRSIRIYITGTVQGVFFRQFIKENAEKLNIRGFARNLEDGRVEVFAEGNDTEVEKIIEICRQGPKQSQIKKIEVKEEKFQDLKNFKVLHI